MSPRGVKSTGDTATEVMSLRIPRLLKRMLEHAAASADEDRNTWVVRAIQERLVRRGDPIEALRAEHAELTERLEVVTAALNRALKDAERR